MGELLIAAGWNHREDLTAACFQQFGPHFFSDLSLFPFSGKLDPVLRSRVLGKLDVAKRIIDLLEHPDLSEVCDRKQVFNHILCVPCTPELFDSFAEHKFVPVVVLAIVDRDDPVVVLVFVTFEIVSAELERIDAHYEALHSYRAANEVEVVRVSHQLKSA